jgi:hypothetical protein
MTSIRIQVDLNAFFSPLDPIQLYCAATASVNSFVSILRTHLETSEPPPRESSLT